MYFSGKIQEIVYPITKNCSGCMYGSYPEITITARYVQAGGDAPAQHAATAHHGAGRGIAARRLESIGSRGGGDEASS